MLCDQFRGSLMLSVSVQVPVDGLYNSVLSRITVSPSPPITNTFPFINVDDVWWYRLLFKLPVLVHVPVDGSYNSALSISLAPSQPAVISTFPFVKVDAV